MCLDSGITLGRGRVWCPVYSVSHPCVLPEIGQPLVSMVLTLQNPGNLQPFDFLVLVDHHSSGLQEDGPAVL